MKLSCFEMMVGDRPLEEKFAMVRDAGFDGIDLRGDLVGDRADEIVTLADRTGVAVAALFSSMDALLAPTVAARAAAMDQLRSRLRTAQAIGTNRLVVVPIFGPAQLQVDLGRGVEDVEWSLLSVLLAEIVAEDVGPDVTIVVEPLNAKETHLVRSPTKAAEFTRHMGHPRIATMVDTYHVDLEGQDQVGELRAAGDQLALVHLSDRDRKLPGLGGIDFGPVVAQLESSGYAGYGGFECSGPFQVAELAQSVEYIRTGAPVAGV